MSNAVERLRAKETNWWEGETPPRYYTFSPATGEYLESGNCDPSPLEPGVWLWPGSSTSASIPDRCPAGYDLVLRHDSSTGNDFWAVVRDRRGEVVYVDGEFRVITTHGDHPELKIEVHDAQYVVPLNDDPLGKIRMWVNDDVIEFYDDPSLVARRVLAAWEAKGETIRPVDDTTETVAERDEREAAQLEADAAAAEARAQAAVEGRNEETDHAE